MDNLTLAKKELLDEISIVKKYSRLLQENKNDETLNKLFKQKLKEERHHARRIARYIKVEHKVMFNERALLMELYKDPVTKIYTTLDGVVTNVSTTPARKLPVYNKFTDTIKSIKSNITNYEVVKSLVDSAKTMISNIIYISNPAKNIIYSDLDLVEQIVKEDLS